MKYYLRYLLTITIVCTGSLSWARNDIAAHSIEDALNNPIAKEKLAGVEFFFGNQKYPKPEKTFQEFKTNNKTNAFRKEDEEACQIAFLSSLISLQKRALSLGANAVVNIYSNYKNKKTVSETQYQCGAGAIMAGVALKGTVVKISD